MNVRWLAAVVALSLAGQVQAQTEKIQDEIDKFLKVYREYGTPGPEHKNLEPFVGRWNVEAKMYGKPGEDPQVSKGLSVSKWSLDKRYVLDAFKGEFAGQAFEGRGMTGYDRFEKKYVSTWADSMSTAIAMMEGKYDPKTKTFTYTSVMRDPYYGGKKMQMRDVIQLISDDEYTMKMYRSEMGSDDEFLTLELHYRRAKDNGKEGDE